MITKYERILLQYNTLLHDLKRDIKHSTAYTDYDFKMPEYTNIIALTLNTYGSILKSYTIKELVTIMIVVNTIGIDRAILILKNSKDIVDFFKEVRFELYYLRLEATVDYYATKRLQRQFIDDLFLIEASL